MSKTSLMAPLCTARETSVPNPFPFLLSPSQHHLPQITPGLPSFWAPSPPSIPPGPPSFWAPSPPSIPPGPPSFCAPSPPSIPPLSRSPQAGWKTPAGLASLTLGPSVPGVPGRPRAPWRPCAPGDPRSPGKPRSPCERDTGQHSGQSDGEDEMGREAYPPKP